MTVLFNCIIFILNMVVNANLERKFTAYQQQSKSRLPNNIRTNNGVLFEQYI